MDFAEIRKKIKGSYSALILFGSYSRGDFKVGSDIDIIQVTNDPINPYSSGLFNISVYNERQLLRMSEEGSLFILHLINEAQVIFGPKIILKNLKISFKPLNNYIFYREELLITADFLDVDIITYRKNWKGYNNLVCYLFRSYLYSKIYDESFLHFSLETVAKYFNDQSITLALAIRRANRSTFDEYLFCKSLFENYAEKKFINPYFTPKRLLEEIKSKSKLTTALTLHFIKDAVGNFNYT